jgi:photosystem II stability/assembly factor-like uncharacterized protein
MLNFGLKGINVFYWKIYLPLIFNSKKMKAKIFIYCVWAVFATGFIVAKYQPKRVYSPANLKKEKESRSYALDALQFTTAAAAYPNKDIPQDAYVSAMNWYKLDKANKLKTKALSSSSTPWISMGPTNIGGRTIAIALDPNDTGTIWLGSASGGLWKSTTGGIGSNAWTYVPLGYPVLGIGAIAINPANSKVMYVGTGEVYSYYSYSQGIVNLRPTRGSYGMGLFKSIDGGNTWTQSINWTYQQNRGIWKIIINPLNPNTVYAATTEGVYKSMDAGNTWTLSLNEKMVMDMIMNNRDTNILLCGVGNYGSAVHGVYRTTNSGGTWTAVTSGLPAPTYQGRICFAEYANGNDTMYAHICDVYNTIGIYESTNSGASWIQLSTQNIASYQGWYSRGLAIQPGNPSNMLAVGVDLFYSTDAGISFSDNTNYLYHTDIHDIIVNPLNPNMVYIITDGGLFRSNDFGSTCYDCNSGYVSSQHYIGSISATDTTVLLSGLQDNNTIKYIPGGGNLWNYVIGGDGSYNAIDHTNDMQQFGSYQYLNVYQSPNQGYSWFQILTNPDVADSTNNYGAFLSPFVLCYSNTSYIYAGGQGLQLSTDGGNSFNFMGNNPVNSNNTWIMTIAASYTNPDSVYFATSPSATDSLAVFFSADSGAHITNISAGLPNRYPRRIAVNPSNSAELYIALSGFGTGHLFKSLNGGKKWTDISVSLPDMPFECITVDPMYPTVLYAGCDYGVFVSMDDGNTWQSFDTGFPDATMVFDILVSPSDRYLYAFTHGRGIFKRDLSSLALGIANPATNNTSFKIYPNPAFDKLNISFDYKTGHTYAVVICDISGKEITSITLTNHNYSIPVSGLSSGAYLVTLKEDSEIQSSSKFIKE